MWNCNWKYFSWAPAWLVERTELPPSWAEGTCVHPTLRCTAPPCSSCLWPEVLKKITLLPALPVNWHSTYLSQAFWRTLEIRKLLGGLQEEFAQDTNRIVWYCTSSRGESSQSSASIRLFSIAPIAVTTGHTTTQKTQTVQATSFSPPQRFFTIFPSASSWAFYPRATCPPFYFSVKAWPQSLTVQHSLPCLWASSDILHNFSPYGQHSFIPHGSLGAGGWSRLLARTRRPHARGHFIPWGTTMKHNSSKKQP